jgi:opacity protein-like surface antigen
MRELIAMMSTVLFMPPALAGGIALPTENNMLIEHQATQSSWYVELEAGLADLLEKENFGSYIGDSTNRCLVDLVCTEDTREPYFGLALFYQPSASYSFGVRYQDIDSLYSMDFGTGVSLRQDLQLFTLAARRHFQTSETFNPFIELGIARYRSEAYYMAPALSIYRNDTHSGWTPVFGAGASYKVSERLSIVPSLRYIHSVGERSGIMGFSGGLHVKTVDDPVTQLSIGLRFEL